MRSRLVLALAVAAVTSALGIVINIATDLKDDPRAWGALVLLTLLSGGVTAAVNGTGAYGRTTSVSVTGRPGRAGRAGSRRTSKVRGIVLQIEVEIRPDGTRVERTSVFSESVAMNMTGRPEPGSAPAPAVAEPDGEPG
ncbi:hypothetical protein Misp01_22190 [Microtetraspora sp. NBRC 13810]|uniref:hypothetical protein n=1 Tax=Microtetraspora sp. NBRC 13810 TaxID=3030990 RepID=UPI0024A3D780|nr:hypothetical protein [Microtetraspora sp. NBRC 13810]GLW07089.1 hypothetical protein Misp01_22190 [Microtetraspora sp. NBRC 13810]